MILNLCENKIKINEIYSKQNCKTGRGCWRFYLDQFAVCGYRDTAWSSGAFIPVSAERESLDFRRKESWPLFETRPVIGDQEVSADVENESVQESKFLIIKSPGIFSQNISNKYRTCERPLWSSVGLPAARKYIFFSTCSFLSQLPLLWRKYEIRLLPHSLSRKKQTRKKETRDQYYKNTIRFKAVYRLKVTFSKY